MDNERPEQKARKYRKELQKLSDAILLFVDWMDTEIGPERSISKAISSKIAKGISALELVNDLVRYGVLGIDFRKDNKNKVIAKLKEGKG